MDSQNRGFDHAADRLLIVTIVSDDPSNILVGDNKDVWPRTAVPSDIRMICVDPQEYCKLLQCKELHERLDCKSMEKRVVYIHESRPSL